jgi:hypothetical protein
VASGVHGLGTHAGENESTLGNSGTLCAGKLDDQLVRLDLDPDNVIVDEGYVIDVGRFANVASNRFSRLALDPICWDPADSFGVFCLAVQKCGRDVVPVLHALLSDMARLRGHSTQSAAPSINPPASR